MVQHSRGKELNLTLVITLILSRRHDNMDDYHGPKTSRELQKVPQNFGFDDT